MRDGRDVPLFFASLCNWHARDECQHRVLPTDSFPSPCVSLTTFPRAPPKGIPPIHLPPTNYSFKVVFRVFRDFHSVPVETLLCSSWNILYVQSQNRSMFQLEHVVRTMFRPATHRPAA